MIEAAGEHITSIEQAAEVLLDAVLRAVRLLRQLQRAEAAGPLRAEVNGAILQLLGLAGGHCEFKAQLEALGLPAARELCRRALELMPDPLGDCSPAEHVRRSRALLAGLAEVVGRAG